MSPHAWPWLLLALPLLACNGDDKGDDDDGDDTGEAEEEPGNYAALLGSWEGEMVQDGFGPFFAALDVVVEAAELEAHVGEYMVQQYDSGIYCIFDVYHQRHPGEGQWMIQVVEIEDPRGACGGNSETTPNFDQDGAVLTLLEDGSLLKENPDGLASGVLYKLSR